MWRQSIKTAVKCYGFEGDVCVKGGKITYNAPGVCERIKKVQKKWKICKKKLIMLLTLGIGV